MKGNLAIRGCLVGLIILNDHMVNSKVSSGEIDIVLPNNIHLSNPQHLGAPYPDLLTIKVQYDQRRLSLRLHQNVDLLGLNYSQIYYHGGRPEHYLHSGAELCVYTGPVVDESGSAVGDSAVTLCHGTLELFMQLDIETLVARWQNGSLVFDNPDYSSSHPDFANLSSSSKMRVRRSTGGVPSYYKRYIDANLYFVEIAFVFDEAVYRKYDRKLELIFNRGKAIANVINTLYRPLNIQIALVGIEVWSDGDKILVAANPDVTLTNFLHYRKQRLNTVIPSQDNAQLITAVSFGEGVVGKALKGTMCSSEFSGGVNMDHSESPVAVGTTIAHELGHNFGMEHDQESCTCPQPRCIMSPSIGSFSPPRFWSSCSLEYLQYGLKHGSAYCLTNFPATPLPYGSCGDGFLQPGEECDCGLPENCDNNCCDARTCHLTEGSKCANGACCDLSSCQLQKATTLCRDALTECDLPEFCDGEREFCPADVHVQSGVECRSGTAYCYNGDCRSHDDQCRLLWGDKSTSHMSPKICFGLNEKGNVHGNCGRRPDNDSYVPCAPNDVLCGQLQCVHQNEKTEFGDKSVVITGHVFIPIWPTGHAICRHAIVDLGGSQRSNPGLVPNGAACDIGRMCLDQKCVEVDVVLKRRTCGNGCGSNGVCNSNGHCHCYPGFGGDRCSESGHGGSVDSGPISFSPSSFNVGAGVLVFLLIILPCITVIVTLVYRNRRRIGCCEDCGFWDKFDGAAYSHPKSKFIPQHVRNTGSTHHSFPPDPIVKSKAQWDEATPTVKVEPLKRNPLEFGRSTLVATSGPNKSRQNPVVVLAPKDADGRQDEIPSLLSSIFEALDKDSSTKPIPVPALVRCVPPVPLHTNQTDTNSRSNVGMVVAPKRPERPPTAILETAMKQVSMESKKSPAATPRNQLKELPVQTNQLKPTSGVKQSLNRSVSNASGCSRDSVRRPMGPPPAPPPKPSKPPELPAPSDCDDDGSFDDSPCPTPIQEHMAAESYYDLFPHRKNEENIYSDIEEFRIRPANKPETSTFADGLPPTNRRPKPIGTATIFNGSKPSAPPPLPQKPPSSARIKKN